MAEKDQAEKLKPMPEAAQESKKNKTSDGHTIPVQMSCGHSAWTRRVFYPPRALRS